jgi:GTP cyclohydrolase I
VLVTDLSFHSMCPHHLLPVRGKAHVSYIPSGKLLGLGKIARLVACFTQRLTLQERATHQIAQALLEHLPAQGAGCVLEAEHLCLAIPGERHGSSRVITSAFVGAFHERPELRSRLLAALG